MRPTVVDTLGPPESTEDRREACLILLYGKELGLRIPIDHEKPFVVGREADCALVLDAETVSRRHAEFKWQDGRYSVADLGSTNGIYVNNMLSEEYSLLDGDQVKIGRNIYKFLQGGNLESNYHEVIFNLMTHDGLTQAHNRRFFEQSLSAEVARASRYRRSLALAIFDIDHFKKLNDAHGHLAGDEVLRQLAQLVIDNIRGEDTLARVGGEEFAILMPEGNLIGAGHLADRLRVMIEQRPFMYEGVEHRITCSFGVADVEPVRGTKPEQLYQAADTALYQAKGAGRNCLATLSI